MVKRSNLNSGFIKTIHDKNLCLSENPKGLDINWPKSFAKLYYSEIAENIFKRNSSPRILEINSKNHLRKVMWLSFFNEPLVIFETINNINDLLSAPNIKDDLKFEMIVIHNYKNINDIFHILNSLKYNLSYEGIIIIENFHFNLGLITRIFFFFETKILDFRLDKFLINNCLIEVKNSIKLNFYRKNLFNIHTYFYHVIVDVLYRIMYKLNKFLNKSK